VSGDPRYRFVRADISDEAAIRHLFNEVRPDTAIHLAGESHVDRSITSSRSFIETNIVGTYTLPEAARSFWCSLAEPEKGRFRFLHVSTDEVYGSLGREGLFSPRQGGGPVRPITLGGTTSARTLRWYNPFVVCSTR